ncbi:heme biosynthesis HemY N-terminal domain-containing protein [Andreprevotia chitinilytica]|uniref:heme biosynthesis HemY N-terminal domain-containing protein n=1 Tax=Andreprevotia chitinilytica TaxID=396808 RepID=UPI0005556C6F|nr:heme biosynthesis HemY N-terminal domain-containing protein [Andreprevotia chitinilytica]
MKHLLAFMALAALAIGLVSITQAHSGYAVLILPPWRIELSIYAFAAILIVLVALLYLLTRLTAELGGLPYRVRRYREAKAREASVKLEREARIAFFEGRYQRAERLSAEGFANSRELDAFAVNGLLAARAAHAMRDFNRRDKHFTKLRERLGPQHLALAMTMAELYLDERRFADADLALTEAKSISPKLTAALKLELKLRQREDRPEVVARIAEQLEKSDAIDSSQALRIRTQAHLSMLSSKPMTAREIKAWWAKLPADERAVVPLVAAVTEALHEQGADKDASEVLEIALNNEWSDELAGIYGLLSLDEEGQIAQLQQAERWLTTHRHDQALLLTLGRLCRRRSLWGKAQTYLEASLAVRPTAVAHAELAAMLEGLDKLEEANRHYRASLALSLPMRVAT